MRSCVLRYSCSDYTAKMASLPSNGSASFQRFGIPGRITAILPASQKHKAPNRLSVLFD
jgi:hypothetical protein